MQEVNLYNGEIKIQFEPHRHAYSLIDKEEPPKKLTSVTAVTGLLDKSIPMRIWATNLACDHLLTHLNQGLDFSKEVIEEARALHFKKTKEAADNGTQVHDWAEKYIKSKIAGEPEPEVPEQEPILTGVLAFMRWVDEHKVEFRSSERIIYSRSYGYTGKMDAEAVIDGKLRLIDFKTSNQRKPRKGREANPCGLCGVVGCGGVYNEYRYQTAAYRFAAEEEGTVYDDERLIVRFDKSSGLFEVHELDGFDRDFDGFLGLLTTKQRELELG